jgi:hypothetical protein
MEEPTIALRILLDPAPLCPAAIANSAVKWSWQEELVTGYCGERLALHSPEERIALVIYEA